MIFFFLRQGKPLRGGEVGISSGAAWDEGMQNWPRLGRWELWGRSEGGSCLGGVERRQGSPSTAWCTSGQDQVPRLGRINQRDRNQSRERIDREEPFCCPQGGPALSPLSTALAPCLSPGSRLAKACLTLSVSAATVISTHLPLQPPFQGGTLWVGPQ